MTTGTTHTPKVLATALVAMLLCGLLAWVAAPARAAEFAVACNPNALIDRIEQANSTSEADTLSLARGCTYTFGVADNDTLGPNALPAVTSRISIEGNGATVERSGAAGTPVFRLFHVAPGGDLKLGALTVRNGLTTGGGADFRVDDGGGILNTGALALDGVTVSGNAATGDFPSGGGVSSDDGTLTLANSTVSGNSAYQGGGVSSDDDALRVSDSTFRDNTARGDAGGVFNRGVATIRNSTLSGNTSGNFGGGIDNEGQLNMTNSTFSGNTASNYGGGISNLFGTPTLVNVTITNNTVNRDGSGPSTAGGGGVYNDFGRAVVLRNTIVAGNTDGSGRNPDCKSSLLPGRGQIISEGYNLIGTPSPGCVIVGETATDVVGVNPRLGPLADNGGPTRTHALLSGSPAIDRIAATRCPPPARDQRGVSRPQDGGGTGPARCDIGSFEKEPSLACTIRGTNGNDTLRGTPRRDVICALGGNDRVFAGGAGDVIRGGPGDDQLQGEGGTDEIQGESGKDVLIGGADADTLVGGTQPDTLTGNDGDDLLNTKDNAPGDVSNGNAGRNTCTSDPGDTVANCT